MKLEELKEIIEECEVAEKLSGKPVLTQSEIELLKHSNESLVDYCKPKLLSEVKRKEGKQTPIDQLNDQHKRLLLQLSDIGGGLGYTSSNIPVYVQQLVELGYADYNGRIVTISKIGLNKVNELRVR